jgi:polysaccharide export outer membrane protein
MLCFASDSQAMTPGQAATPDLRQPSAGATPAPTSSTKSVQSPARQQPSSPDYTLQIGDKIHYSILEEGKDCVVLLVDEQGEIQVPILGKMPAQGKTLQALSADLQKALTSTYYKRATLYLRLFEAPDSRGKIFMMGQVANQGPMGLPENEILTVTRALLRAGGLTPAADAVHVTIFRRDPQANEDEAPEQIRVNLQAILQSGDFRQDLILKPDDVVFVPEKGDLSGKIFVVGEVKSPGYYPLPEGKSFTLSQALLQAGGFTEFSNRKKVKIIRDDGKPDTKDKTLVVDAEKIFRRGDRTQDISLQDNDMIIVEESWINF